MHYRAVLSGFILGVTLAFTSPAIGGGEPLRGISIDEVLKIADGAIGYPKGRPENFEVVSAKLFAMKHQDLTLEGVPGDPKAWALKLEGKQYWLVQYRRWPIRLDGGLAAFVDAHSGEVLGVARDR